MMKISELREKSIEDLRSLLLEKREELAQFHLTKSTKQLPNVREIRSTRKEIAQILTLLNSPKKTTEDKQSTLKED